MDGLRRGTKATPAKRKKRDIELLELIAKDPQAFILKQGWASVSLNGDHGLKELRSIYEHLQARILEMNETLDDKVVRPPSARLTIPAHCETLERYYGKR